MNKSIVETPPTIVLIAVYPTPLLISPPTKYLRARYTTPPTIPTPPTIRHSRVNVFLGQFSFLLRTIHFSDLNRTLDHLGQLMPQQDNWKPGGHYGRGRGSMSRIPLPIVHFFCFQIRYKVNFFQEYKNTAKWYFWA